MPRRETKFWPQVGALIMIAIDPDLQVSRGALPKRELGSFVREVCAAIPLAGEVSVLLGTDAAIQELNRSFRRKDKPTDVLSFPAADAGFPQGAGMLAGDLAVSIDTAKRQAEEFGHSLLLEVKILLLHGLLHLAGFDHEQDTGRMARRERALRRKFALPAGLIQRAGATETVANSRTPPVKKAVLEKTAAKKTTRVKPAIAKAVSARVAPVKVRATVPRTTRRGVAR